MAETTKGYLSKAQLSNVHVSPRKARLVVDMIRGKSVARALEDLKFCDKKTASSTCSGASYSVKKTAQYNHSSLG